MKAEVEPNWKPTRRDSKAKGEEIFFADPNFKTEVNQQKWWDPSFITWFHK